MPQVLGIGGVFVKSKDPEKLRAWYREMLGIDGNWGAKFVSSEGAVHVWNSFAMDTKKFEASDREFMINLRVDDTDAMAKQLRERGANVLDTRSTDQYATFCYVVDPEGTLIELWSAVPN
jgi:predicted enzyme related to lactoylglutathione lyase